MEEGAALLCALPSPRVNFSYGSGHAAAPLTYLLSALTPSIPIEGKA